LYGKLLPAPDLLSDFLCLGGALKVSFFCWAMPSVGILQNTVEIYEALAVPTPLQQQATSARLLQTAIYLT